ncbi:restriction endonuclease [Lactiplantibacillus garii]|uniref:Restriction endonuclease n=1 Tax=Lactiplantibacillus garii TaxID=2306423 RepID=A0A3R8QPX7_9LACO|nr:restriction endonuclease [Lactiplantibacillus garii]RRK09712.1 restriction endonuclease [Lactiplantibacillus garii]
MSIMWNYLDKRRATIAALKDYDGMKFIIDSYRDDLKQVKEQMMSINSPQYGFAPSGTKKDNPTEHRLLHGISQTAKLNERYQQAQLYFKWFEPAWDELSEDEHFILDVCYRTPHQSMNEGLTIVMNKYFIAKTTAYNRKNKALDHLTLLLYGAHH